MSTDSFTTLEASRLTGFSVRQLNYWDSKQILRPSLQQSHGPGTRKIYSSEDLVQLRILRQLKLRGWSTQRIRNAIATLRDVIKDPDPLRYAVIFDGKSTLLALCKTRAGERVLIDSLNPGGQQVMWIVVEVLAEEARALMLASSGGTSDTSTTDGLNLAGTY